MVWMGGGRVLVWCLFPTSPLMYVDINCSLFLCSAGTMCYSGGMGFLAGLGGRVDIARKCEALLSA